MFTDRLSRRRLRSLHFFAAWILALVPFHALALSAPGYVVTEIATSDVVAGDVVAQGGAIFVGIGPFGGGAQSVVRIDGTGTTTLATGFNALSGFAYDAVNDRLLVGDNALEAPGATTGDTVYAITTPFGTLASPAAAPDLELLAAGTLPGVADVILDPDDPSGGTLLVSDASGSFPPDGKLWRVSIGSASASVLTSGLGFAAGLASSASSLFLGDLDAATFSGRIFSLGLPGPSVPPTLLASGLAGSYDIELASDGTLLVSAFDSLLRLDPSDGSVIEVVATGFGFAAGLFESGGVIYALDGGFPGVAKVFVLTPIPEPSLPLLLGAGLALLGARRRPAGARGVAR
jgi:hypothetical protein